DEQGCDDATRQGGRMGPDREHGTLAGPPVGAARLPLGRRARWASAVQMRAVSRTRRGAMLHTYHRRPAFTIVELLIVIFIISVLIALTLPLLARMRDAG